MTLGQGIYESVQAILGAVAFFLVIAWFAGYLDSK